MSNKKNKLASKKAAVMEEKKKSVVPVILIAAVCLAVAVAGASIWLKGGTEGPAVAVTSQPEEIVSQISYPVAMFDDGAARHFEYKDGDISVRYFILKSSDGVVRAAFDACDVCWPAGKGYYQEGDHMVCRNCGRRFVSVRINEVQGGCNPAPLRRNISGDNLVIRVEDILEGRKYFDFS